MRSKKTSAESESETTRLIVKRVVHRKRVMGWLGT